MNQEKQKSACLFQNEKTRSTAKIRQSTNVLLLTNIANDICFSAVKPNNFEKQKVKLAFNAFSWPVRNALLYYSEENPEIFPPADVSLTVKFMDACREFFEILNVNHVKKGPIQSENSPKVKQLQILSSYFKDVSAFGILTKDTSTALQLTISASISVIKLLLSARPNSVIMTAYFQQDPIEQHFGHHRNQVGCAYRVTSLQFHQTERKLTNLAALKGSNYCNTAREKVPVLEWNASPLLILSKSEIDEIVCLDEIQVLHDHNYSKEPEEFKFHTELDCQSELAVLDETTKTTLLYIRGSIVRRILNRLSCEVCTSAFVENIMPAHTSSYLIQMDFSGNSLLEPSALLFEFFHIQLTAYLALKNGLQAVTKQNTLQKLRLAGLHLLEVKNFSLPFCENHNEKVLKQMTNATMKTFLKAYIHEMNEKFSKGGSFVQQKSRKLRTVRP